MTQTEFRTKDLSGTVQEMFLPRSGRTMIIKDGEIKGLTKWLWEDMVEPVGGPRILGLDQSVFGVGAVQEMARKVELAYEGGNRVKVKVGVGPVDDPYQGAGGVGQEVVTNLYVKVVGATEGGVPVELWLGSLADIAKRIEGQGQLGLIEAWVKEMNVVGGATR